MRSMQKQGARQAQNGKAFALWLAERQRRVRNWQAPPSPQSGVVPAGRIACASMRFLTKKDPRLVNSIAPPFIYQCTVCKNKGRGRHNTAEHLLSDLPTDSIACETGRLRRPHNRVQCLQAARRNPREYLRSDKIISGDACGTENLCIAAIRIQPSAGVAAGSA